MSKPRIITNEVLNQIKRQYQAGVSILGLSREWKIPYATLYRALKGSKKPGRSSK